MDDIKYYVVRKAPGFVTTLFANYENVSEDVEKATPVAAEEILQTVTNDGISLVTDSDPDVWEVEHMKGSDLTLELLNSIK